MAAGLLAMIVTGCGSSTAPSGSPSAAPTPVVTPDPHLREPVAADDIYRDISKGLPITAINANLGQGNPDIVKTINANLRGWPLRITQYQSSTVMLRALHWAAGQAPGSEEGPYAFAALNILVVYGPISARAPSLPTADRQADAAAIVAVLDPFLWPITQHSVLAIPSRTPLPVATPAPTAKPTPKATAKPTPKPTAKPKPTARPTPKPTKKP